VSFHILLCTIALIWTLSLVGSDDELTRVFPARYGLLGTLEFFEHVPNHLLLWIAVALALTLGIMGFYLMRLLRRKKQFLLFAFLAAFLGAISIFFIMNRIGPYATLREDVHGNWIRNRAFVSAFHYNDDTLYGSLLNFIGTMSFFELVGIPVLAFSKRRKTTFVNGQEFQLMFWAKLILGVIVFVLLSLLCGSVRFPTSTANESPLKPWKPTPDDARTMVQNCVENAVDSTANWQDPYAICDAQIHKDYPDVKFDIKDLVRSPKSSHLFLNGSETPSEVYLDCLWQAQADRKRGISTEQQYLVDVDECKVEIKRQFPGFDPDHQEEDNRAH
jgi:hypothetical protein